MQIRSSKVEICWSEGRLEAEGGLMYDTWPCYKPSSVLQKKAFMVVRVAWDLGNLHAGLDSAPTFLSQSYNGYQPASL